MGCCISMFKGGPGSSGGTANDSQPLIAGCRLRLSDVFHVLPVNVYLQRYEECPPTTCLDHCSMHQLLLLLPLHLRNRRLIQSFSTKENGFSFPSFRHAIEDARSTHSHVNTNGALIVVHTPTCIIGAYLSKIPEPGVKMYQGTNECFVFEQKLNSTGGGGAGVVGYPATSFVLQQAPDGGSDGDATAQKAKALSSSDASNEYFIRLEEDTLSIGGGGKGPTMHLADDFNRVSSSVRCPTFDFSCPMTSNTSSNNGASQQQQQQQFRSLLPASGDGITVEGGEPSSCVLGVEFYVVAQDAFYLATSSVPCPHSNCRHVCS